MTRLAELEAITVAAVILISPVVGETGRQSRSLNENAALDLLERTLKRDHVYEKRI